MEKKIRDLSIKEFYKFLTDNVKGSIGLIGIYSFEQALDCLKSISIEQYIKEMGDKEVEI